MSARLHFGLVAEVDAAAARVRVRLPELDDALTNWLPVGQARTLRNKHYLMPDVDEHVAVLLDGEDGVVMCAIYSAADAPPATEAYKSRVEFADGVAVEYDSQAHMLKIEGECDVQVNVQGDARVQAREAILDAETTRCTGDLVVAGKVTAAEAEVTSSALTVAGVGVGPTHAHSHPLGPTGGVIPAP